MFLPIKARSHALRGNAYQKLYVILVVLKFEAKYAFPKAK